DGNPPACIHGGAENDFLEQVDGKMLGTGKCEEHAAGGELFQRVQIEKLVPSSSRIQVGSFVRQRRRIQDDQIEFFVDLFQIGKGVTFENFSRRVRKTVEIEVLFGQLQRGHR